MTTACPLCEVGSECTCCGRPIYAIETDSMLAALVIRGVLKPERRHPEALDGVAHKRYVTEWSPA